MTNQKIIYQLLIFVNLYQHAKNEAVSSICSGEIVDLKILQSDWLRAFWPISKEQNFHQQQRCCAGTKKIIKIFIIEQIQRKLISNFFFKFKKPYF